MRLSTRVLLGLNRLFPVPEHPFNRALAGGGSYADWQFEQAPKSVTQFRGFADPATMVSGKRCLDMGCGAGGKAVYFASLGAVRVVGVDVVPHYAEEGRELARRKGYGDVCEFITASATELPFADNCFDLIMANDVIEHLAEPERSLQEAYRVLAPGGRIYISFPPYNHPYGAHLSDAIGFPWVHVFFSEPVLGEAYSALVRHLPDAGRRLDLRFGRDRAGELQITYINHMTIRWFRRIIEQLPFQVAYYLESPLRPFLRPFQAALPEYFTRMVVCVLQK